MSSTLYWQPIIKNKKSLPRGIRNALREYLEYSYVETTLDSSHEDILKAFAIAQIDGAQELLNALIEHGEVKVFEEC